MEKNKIEILKCKEYDIEEVFQIEVECFNDPWSRTMLLDEFSARGSIFLKCVLNNVIVGYIIARKVLDELDIINVAIKKEYRARGLGSKMIEEVLSITDNISIYSLEVRESNTPAIELYKKFGFERIGIRKNYYQNPKEDGLIMVRRNRC